MPATANPELKQATRKMFNEEIAKRFLTFREAYVHKSQNQAAKMLGVSQSTLSYIESADRAPSLQLLDILIEKFKLNAEWLATGTGKPLEKNPGKKTLITDIGNLNDEINMLRKQVKVLEATQNHLIKQMQRLESRLDGK